MNSAKQRTATVTVAGFINACRIVNKKIGDVKIAMVGAGASNYRIAKVLMAAGVTPKNIVMTDTKGTLHKDREDRAELQAKYKEKWDICINTNGNNVKGGVPEAMKGADAVIALSTPGPGVIKKEWVKSMATGAIVFVCANPTPEIWPWEAKEAGAAVVATGRSDFPNQVNNSLGFPGIFRGTLDVQAKTITDEMCIAAAYELAQLAVDKGLDAEHLLPTMDDWEVFPREAVAVGMKAIEQGVARRILTKEQLFEMAVERISRARGLTRMMMDTGFIKIPSSHVMMGD
jgi:malate dehydrogenase (oxaloacetate-decarboxylating)